MKAILFDLDNTLVDFNSVKRKCSEAAVKAMISAGLKMKEKQAIDSLYKMYSKHGIEDHTIYQKFLRKHNAFDYKILAAGIVAYRKVRRWKAFKGVKGMLSKLRKKCKLAIVTDAPKLKAYIRLTEMGIVDYFDVVVAFEDTGKLKPNPEPFLKAMKELGVEAGETVVVGDDVSRDKRGAESIGARFVGAIKPNGIGWCGW